VAESQKNAVTHIFFEEKLQDFMETKEKSVHEFRDP
jgi:hypothetical protein